MTPSHHRRGAVLVALFVAALPLGCGKVEPPEKVPPATVKWSGPYESALEEWTELAGTTTPLPDRIARVSAPVEASVRSVLTTADGKPVAEGQQVAQGTVLVQLNDTIAKTNLASLEATQKSLVEDEVQAQGVYDQALNEVDKLRKLKEQDPKLVYEIDIQRADFALRDAKSKLQAAVSKLNAGAKAVDALKEQLKLYALAAPIAGRIGRIQVARGQALHVGDPVADILDIDEEIDVLCWVPAGMVARLKVGQDARSGSLEKDPKNKESEAVGKVAFVADQADPDTGNFAVKVRFSNKTDSPLRANRLIRVRIQTQPARQCLSLPESAVMEDEEPPSVVIVENIVTGKNADGKEETTGVARRLQVELGVRDRTLHQIEILRLTDPENKWHGDLKEAQFIVTGLQGLQTGDAVKLEADDD